MSKRGGRTESQGLGGYLLPMLVSAVVGAGIMWVIMSQRQEPGQQRPVAFMTPGAKQKETLAPLPAEVSKTSAADAAVIRGNQAYDHQQWAEAIEFYQEAIAKGLDNADVRTDLGNAFRFSGEPEKALEQYTIAQGQNPQHENSLFNQIGLFMDVMRVPARAIPVCEEFLRRFPNSDKAARAKEQLDLARSL